MPIYRRAAAGIGFVPQEREIFPSLTVRENLDVGARPGAWTDERLFELFPNLAERLTNKGNQLSGGEQQMLSIARALRTNPSVLLMDEPTEGLAPVIVEALTAVLVRLRSESKLSIILVEQNSRVAFEFSDRSVVMDKGRIVYDGASKSLRDDPERLGFTDRGQRVGRCPRLVAPRRNRAYSPSRNSKLVGGIPWKFIVAVCCSSQLRARRSRPRHPRSRKRPIRTSR